MQQEYKELCKHYGYRAKIYDEFFDQLLDWLRQHPKASKIEFQKAYQDITKLEINAGAMRMIMDIHTVYNTLYLKVEPSLAEVSIDIEDGDKSSLSWTTVNHERMLVLSDIHFPYHDAYAVMQSLREGRKREVDSILLNGDILDFYQLSKFAKDHRKPSIRAELDIFRYFIDQLKQRFPDATIYYKEGNHEMRLIRWIQQNAQMFDGMFDLSQIIQWNDHGIKYLSDNIGVKFGKLNIIHGHEIRAGMGVVNIARTYFMKAQANLLFGHWHQNQEYITRTMDGHIQGAWAQGCLCKLDAEYTFGINQWVHGFSIVDRVNEEGDFRVKLYKIINGEIV